MAAAAAVAPIASAAVPTPSPLPHRRLRFQITAPGWVVALAGIAGLACLVPLIANAAEPTLAPAAQPRADLAERVFERINEVRLSAGLGTLERHPALDALAQEHSRAMQALGRPSHDGFQGRFDRVRSRLCVENVAAGYTQAPALVDGWQAAPAHRRNLFEPRVRSIGVASAGRYVTMFACE